jgi:hypothetical protein
VTLAERWGSFSWATQTMPLLAGTERHELLGVSCKSAKACIAVGYSEKETFHGTGLAESWNGTEWSTQTVAKPAGAKETILEGVSCNSTTSCTAVGWFLGEKGVRTVAEHWNGTSWTIQTTPSLPEGGGVGFLTRVSCISAEACTAVGNYTSGGNIVTLAERWNGKEWTVQTTPNPPEETTSVLLDVSCPSTEACTAVGGAQHGANTQITLVERWNGKEWKIQTSPNPAGAKASILHGVSCPTSEACVAVGDYVNASAKNVTLAEGWNGKEWTLQTTSDPAGNTFAALWGVSCTTSTSCRAAGYSTETIDKTLTEVFE